MKAQAHAEGSGKSCVPHALAQLTDHDAQEVREFFRATAERILRERVPGLPECFRLDSWDALFENNADFIGVAYERTILEACEQFAPFGRRDSLAAHLLGPRRLAGIIGAPSLTNCNGVTFKPGEKVRRLRVKGRGICRLVTPNLNIGHVVAWADGKVYDPAFVGHAPDGGVDFSIWRKIYRRVGWRLDYLTEEK